MPCMENSKCIPTETKKKKLYNKMQSNKKHYQHSGEKKKMKKTGFWNRFAYDAAANFVVWLILYSEPRKLTNRRG